MSITTQLILQDARRASIRAAFSLFVTISGIALVIVGAATGFDFIGW